MGSLRGMRWGMVGVVLALLGFVGLRKRRMDEQAAGSEASDV